MFLVLYLCANEERLRPISNILNRLDGTLIRIWETMNLVPSPAFYPTTRANIFKSFGMEELATSVILRSKRIACDGGNGADNSAISADEKSRAADGASLEKSKWNMTSSLYLSWQ